jgi:hypothetical protein
VPATCQAPAPSAVWKRKLHRLLDASRPARECDEDGDGPAAAALASHPSQDLEHVIACVEAVAIEVGARLWYS